MIFIENIITVLVTVLLFGIIIFVHELGHFIFARIMNVKVNEFAMGMGPKLLRIQGKETLYSLRAFPIGGFCAMEGEDESSGDPRSFGQKKVWKRVCILIAGAAMNLALGFLLLLVYFGVFTTPQTKGEKALYATTTIADFQKGSVSNEGENGLKKGDKILKVNGRGVINSYEMSIQFQSDEDGLIDLQVKRDGKKVNLNSVQFEIRNKGKENQSLFFDFIVLGEQKGFVSTITQSAKMEVAIARLVWRSLVDIVTGKFGLNDLAGPVGVGTVVGDVVGNNSINIGEKISSLLLLVTMITINVGVFNLLPLPALDGGRLMFLAFEGVFRRPVNPKYEGIIHAVGLILMFGLMIIVTFSDIIKLIKGG